MGLLEARHEGDTPDVIDRGPVGALLAESREAKAHGLSGGLSFADRIDIDRRHGATPRLPGSALAVTIRRLACQRRPLRKFRRRSIII